MPKAAVESSELAGPAGLREQQRPLGRQVRFEFALVDPVASEFLADRASREAAMLGAPVDPPPVAFEDAFEVDTFDPFGQLVGDRLELATLIEVERERFFASRDDLRR